MNGAGGHSTASVTADCVCLSICVRASLSADSLDTRGLARAVTRVADAALYGCVDALDCTHMPVRGVV